jgi:hypothetical protein
MRSLLLLAVFSVSAAAQSFNVDVGDNLILFPVPSDGYGAAAGQTGRWTASSFPYSTTLLNLDGTPSSVTTSSTSSSSYSYFPSMLTGDDYDFMVDVQNLPAFSGPYTWTFAGLQNGSYELTTYAWAPENSGAMTRVTVPGSMDPPQNVGGLWSGGPHVLGVTFARHQLTVAGGTFTIVVEGLNNQSGSINGFQLVRQGGPIGFCFGDGSATPCPCGNAGAPGRGCANSVNAPGARLLVAGNPSVGADSLVLLGDGMPNAPALYFQGTAQQNGGLGVVFGDGLRCAGGMLVRLGTKTNSNGASAHPGPGDIAISVAGNLSAGDLRTYQVWYRNAAAFCTGDTFNLSNGVQVTWSM